MNITKASIILFVISVALTYQLVNSKNTDDFINRPMLYKSVLTPFAQDEAQTF